VACSNTTAALPERFPTVLESLFNDAPTPVGPPAMRPSSGAGCSTRPAALDPARQQTISVGQVPVIAAFGTSNHALACVCHRICTGR
jgi:hypothetical protein